MAMAAGATPIPRDPRGPRISGGASRWPSAVALVAGLSCAAMLFLAAVAGRRAHRGPGSHGRIEMARTTRPLPRLAPAALRPFSIPDPDAEALLVVDPYHASLAASTATTGSVADAHPAKVA